MREPSARLGRRLGHSFADPELLEQALTHRSAGPRNNERLEFLGDALLGQIIAEALFFRHPQADEGQLSRLRAGLVRKDSLALVARGLELGEYLNLGPGELRSGGHARDSILADAVEAVIAAVYLDGGMAASKSLVLRLFDELLDRQDPHKPLKDPKTRLQELLQSRRQDLPEYGIIRVGGTQHDQEFEVFCRVAPLDEETQGVGSSRRKAEQVAAEKMITRLGGD